MANWEPNDVHLEISPREREDDLERDRRDFDPEPEEHVWYEIRWVEDE